jgi:hypothetical protein
MVRRDQAAANVRIERVIGRFVRSWGKLLLDERRESALTAEVTDQPQTGPERAPVGFGGQRIEMNTNGVPRIGGSQPNPASALRAKEGYTGEEAIGKSTLKRRQVDIATGRPGPDDEL